MHDMFENDTKKFWFRAQMAAYGINLTSWTLKLCRYEVCISFREWSAKTLATHSKLI